MYRLIVSINVYLRTLNVDSYDTPASPEGCHFERRSESIEDEGVKHSHARQAFQLLKSVPLWKSGRS